MLSTSSRLRLRLALRQIAFVQRLCSSDASAAAAASVVYQDGLPRFRVPLPSKARVCQFTVKPLSNTVRDLAESIKEEDRGVDVVAFYTEDGVRIAGSDSVESLLRRDFELQLNDSRLPVSVPAPAPDATSESAERLADVRSVVGQLHAAMNLQQHQLGMERQIARRLQELRHQLEPLENDRKQLAARASRRTQVLSWLGLSFMSLQFGLLARLTWWEYSWDIMEPVTYFVTTGTAIACYAYYVLTKQEYTFPQVWDREYLKKFYKDAGKKQFNVQQYNELRLQINDLESDLRRLRDPLLMNLPLQQAKFAEN